VPAPAAARRHFAHYQAAALDDPAHRPFLIARLLEDGDGADLRWLLAEVGEAALGAWLERHGGRQLSRRSRVFWERVLARDAPAPPAAAAALWPL
jgi:hypothetical protein